MILASAPYLPGGRSQHLPSGLGPDILAPVLPGLRTPTPRESARGEGWNRGLLDPRERPAPARCRVPLPLSSHLGGASLVRAVLSGAETLIAELITAAPGLGHLPTHQARWRPQTFPPPNPPQRREHQHQNRNRPFPGNIPRSGPGGSPGSARGGTYAGSPRSAPPGPGGARPEPERGCRPSGARRDIAAPKPCSCRKTPSVPARAGSPGPGTRDTHGPRFPAQRCGAGAGLTLCPRGCRAARAPPARSSRCPRRGRPEAAAGHGRAAPPPAPP